MTPRALLTAIAATAIGFAIAIGSASSITPGTTPTAEQHTVQVTGAIAYSDAGTGLASGLGAGAPLRIRSAGDHCPVAL